MDIVEQALRYIESQFERGETFDQPEKAAQYFCLRLGVREREVFACAFLDNRHRLIETEDMFLGTIDGANVHAREVVKSALKHNAGAVVFAHNHPSGVPEPSKSDEAITTRLKDALALVDIRVLDHIIVGGSSHCSFAERGLI